VHKGGGELQRAVGDLLVSRIDSIVGYPLREPDDNPIQPRSGGHPADWSPLLAGALEGARSWVSRISYEDSAMRYLARIVDSAGARLLVVDREPFGESPHVEARGRRRAVHAADLSRAWHGLP
jgi:hypothetical protein